MATYELIYSIAGHRDLVDIKDYEVLPDGGLEYHYGKRGKVEQLSQNAEWVITALPTEAVYCGVSHEEAWNNLHYETAGEQETIGIMDYHKGENGTLAFRRIDGRSGLLNASAEWATTDRSGYIAEYEEDYNELTHHPIKERSLPPNWNKIRKRAYEKDAYTCQYCRVRGGEYGDAELHAHHLVPKEVGGVHDLHNLLTFCRQCHRAIHEERAAPKLG